MILNRIKLQNNTTGLLQKKKKNERANKRENKNDLSSNEENRFEQAGADNELCKFT